MNIFDSWIVNSTILRYGLTSDVAPENTYGAYDASINKKCPILICAQSLDDENIVCFSYKNVSLLTNGTGYVQTLKLDEIKNLKVNKTEFNVLTLNEALNYINGQVPVLINIFNDGSVGKVEANINSIIKDYAGEIAIMSANPQTVEWFKNNNSEILRGIKSGKFESKTYGSFSTRKLAKLKYNKICEPDFIVYNACDLPNRFVKKFNYLPIIAYNVKNEQDYLHAIKHSDNVICDGFIPEI